MKTWGIYILVALGFFIYGATTDVDRDDSGAIVDEGNVDAFQIRVGDCFDDISGYEGEETEFSSVPGVPCSEPHDNEAFAVFDLDIDTFPGTDAIGELAQESCLQRFSSFVGRDYESSSLDIFAMYPTPEGWRQDDREVICAVYDMEANKLVGSTKGRAL